MAPERRISQVRCLERDSLTALRRAQVRNASAFLCGGWLLRGKVCWPCLQALVRNPLPLYHVYYYYCSLAKTGFNHCLAVRKQFLLARHSRNDVKYSPELGQLNRARNSLLIMK